MRIALISDIHGNPIALDAVLADVKVQVKPRLQASYALLEADSNGYELQPRYIDYNNQAVIEELQRVKHPTADFLAQFMRGEVVPPWTTR